MLRAIFFDFYGVWTPDRFADLIAQAEQSDQAVANELRELLQRYYLGLIELEQLVDSFRFKLNLPNLNAGDFKLKESDISPQAIKFIQYLHTHFLKVGILAQVGKNEHELLVAMDKKYQLFETIVDSYESGKDLLTKEIFVKALRQIGEPQDSCLIVTGHEDIKAFAESLEITSLRYEGFADLTSSIENVIENQQNI